MLNRCRRASLGFFFFVGIDVFLEIRKKKKSTSLLMHAAVSNFLYQLKKKKSGFLSSGELTHFWLSEFCFFLSVCAGGQEREVFFFNLAISELNFIPPPFAWNGRTQR